MVKTIMVAWTSTNVPHLLIHATRILIAQILWAAMTANVKMDSLVMVSSVLTLTNVKLLISTVILMLRKVFLLALRNISNWLRPRGWVWTISKCVNKAGFYECECNTGFTGTGQHCDDIDECEQGLGKVTTSTGTAFGHFCDHHENCINNRGGYLCECKEGFYGKTCDDFDECIGRF